MVGHVPAQRPWPDCPPWCVVRHGVLQGEEDWVHMSAPEALGPRTLARLCATVAPDTGRLDGPYVLLGEQEYTVEDALSLGGSVAVWLRRVLGPAAAAGTHSPGR